MNTSLSKIIALLGPTNTGKTYVAIEKMLEFEWDFWPSFKIIS